MSKTIFSDEEIETGLALREMGDYSAFALGDYCVTLVDRYQPQTKGKTIEDFALEIGAEEATLHVYEWLSRKITRVMREQYPALSWSQWRACAQAGDLERTTQTANWAVESADDFGGKPAPVRAIYGYLNNPERQAGQQILSRFRRWLFGGNATHATCPDCQHEIEISRWAEAWYNTEAKTH